MALTRITDGIWTDSEPVSILGTRLSTNMTVLDLGAAGLLVHSPVVLTAERRAAVEALGTVAHLYAPNTFHHMWIGDWAAAFASARLHAPAELARKRPDLRIDRSHETGPEPAFDGIVDELRIDGFRLQETVVIHRPSRTAIVADLVHNIGQPPGGWTRLYTKTMGFYDRVALSRAIRWAGFDDREAARRSIDELLERPFDRLLVGHGAPIETGARELLAAAYAWLHE